MEESKLVKTFKRLSQGSKQSVQNGQDLDAFDKYLHVERPIKKAVRKAMDEIREQNGGLLLLVGSAGDGKSHMIASLKKDYPDFKYRNDASESPDPKMEAREYLKQCLEDFNNDSIDTTNTKLLVAINMGKLSEFIDDDDVKERFREIVECAQSLFDEDNLRHDQTQRVRIVSFGNHQIFELYPEKTEEEYPVDSEFIRTVLKKITQDSANNVFYQAYKDSKPIGEDYDPAYVNYELLRLPAVQDSIVKILIEAIIRYKLLLTPRELFDFVYRIVVPDTIKDFKKAEHFFSSLLPSLIFGGGESRILKTIALLDPLKQGCINHNNRLSDLFTSVDIPKDLAAELDGKIHKNFFDILTQFYHNNRKDVDNISKLIFRLEHLLNYHSESAEYRDFLAILCGYYAKDIDRFDRLYEKIIQCIPHYYGSYTTDDHIVPLNIQGRDYKLFVSCKDLQPVWNDTDVDFDTNNRNQFVIEILTRWEVQKELTLKVEYQLYEDLCKICNGKLTLATERDHNLLFGKFISELVLQTDYQNSVMILSPDNKQFTLKRGLSQKLTLK